MTLALARIDDRLIHGQVVVGWVKYVNANCIIVANDAIAADPMQRALLPMAVPPEIQVGIFKVAEAAQQLKLGKYQQFRVLLLFASPSDVVEFMSQGGELSQLNIGGMRFGPGKKQVLNSISLGADDVRAFRDLAERHLKMSVQMVPTDSPADILEYFPEEGG